MPGPGYCRVFPPPILSALPTPEPTLCFSKDASMFHVDVSFPTLEILLSSLMIFGLRVSDVSLATFRILMITRGRTRLAATLGFGEAAIWVVAISQVITHVGNLWNMIAYASGFAAGTLFGMWLESKLAFGDVDLRVISLRRETNDIAEAIRGQGYGVTEVEGRGLSGPVHVVAAVVPRKAVPKLVKLVREVDPGSFVTMDDVRWVSGGFVGIIK
ncbi:MAG: DUF2179 domain-containing protein [Acidobacteria bacterium]|nr:DUF2179 domain-containing protein [Acidobacteriota bacterium]